jgi:hypothetical protein
MLLCVQFVLSINRQRTNLTKICNYHCSTEKSGKLCEMINFFLQKIFEITKGETDCYVGGRLTKDYKLMNIHINQHV